MLDERSRSLIWIKSWVSMMISGLILIKPSSTHTPKNVCSANLGIWNRPMHAHQVMTPGDIPQSSSNDQRICSDVLAAIQQAAWRPDRLDVNVRDGVVDLAG